MNHSLKNRNFVKLLIVLSLVCLVVIPVNAQLSEYHQTYLKHAKVVKKYHSYIDEFSFFINSPPPETNDMVQSLGMVYAMFNDDVIPDFEAEAKLDFEQSVINNLINDYPSLQLKVDQTIEQVAAAHAKGKPFDGAAENQMERIRLAIEHNYFALPLVIFEGKNPYYDMYRQLLDAYQLYIQGPGGGDLLELTFYHPDEDDFGSIEVVSVTERNQSKAAQTQTNKDTIAAESALLAKNNQVKVDAQMVAFKKQANEDMKRAQKDAIMLTERAQENQGGFGFFSFVFVLTIFALCLWWFKSHLPKPLSQPIETAEKYSKTLFNTAKSKVTAKLNNRKQS